MRMSFFVTVAVASSTALMLAAPGAWAPGGPSGEVQEDCFGVHYSAEGTNGGLSTHWVVKIGGNEVDSGDGPLFASSGPGEYFRSTVLYANGVAVASFTGPWCV
jgi:hypothetical protein